ncbi:MAG: tetratricopeptide repeat protein [Verrucomicrobia bacterium]|nr:tetratricopeptide repeat protein [Verrucomicrobiota bacterium]
MPPESRRPSSVASTPAAAPASEGSKGPDLGLEWEIFWTQHWKKGIAAILIALAGIIVFSVWQYLAHSASRAANAQLSAAKTIDDLKKVLADHPNADAAADAGLLLAQKQGEAKDFEGAVKTAQTVAERFPKHPMYGAALLAIASNLEAGGKADQAETAYKTVVEKAPNDFAAPLALSARANLIKRKKPEEARKILDELTAKYPTSVASTQAVLEKKTLRGGEAGADVFQMPPPTPLPTPAPEAAAAPGTPGAPQVPFMLATPPPNPEVGSLATPAAPAEAKPADAKPADAKPADAKPADAKPAASPAATPKAKK